MKKNRFYVIILAVLLVIAIVTHWPIWISAAVALCSVVILINIGIAIYRAYRKRG